MKTVIMGCDIRGSKVELLDMNNGHLEVSFQQRGQPRTVVRILPKAELLQALSIYHRKRDAMLLIGGGH